MSYKGIDASYAKPTGAELQHAGIKAAMLYITPSGPGDKGITQEVWDDYTAHRVSIGFVWEEGENAVLKGYNQGVLDAKAAQAHLHSLKGPSDSRPLYFAIDFDIQAEKYKVCSDYFKGVTSVIGAKRTGAYGHAAILNHLTDQHLIVKRWVSVGWQYHGMPKHVDIVQYQENVKLGSGTVDLNQFYSRNWGQDEIK